MKKIVSMFLAAFVLFGFAIVSVGAQNTTNGDSVQLQVVRTYTEYAEDGSYTVTTIEESVAPIAMVYTRVGHKTAKNYDSDGNLQWDYTLVGAFRVTSGESAVCTASTYSYKIYDDHWSLTDHTNSFSGDTAYSTATFKRKVLFVTTNTFIINAHLTCDKNGNLS